MWGSIIRIRTAKTPGNRKRRKKCKMDKTRAILFLLMSVFVFEGVESAAYNQEALFQKEEGHALSNHTIKSMVVHDAIECGFQCLRSTLCKSVNYQQGNVENRLCQLNNKRKGSGSSGDYQAASGFTYYEKNPCVPSPCSYAGSCSKVNGVEEFNCTCLAGFKGRLCESERSGWFSRNPGASCKAILDAGDALHDGTYWIDPGNQGKPLRVYCDMTTNEGGWLLVTNIVIPSSAQPSPTTLTTSFRDISNYNNNHTLISATNLGELRQLMPFTQLRFQCYKSNVGRMVHIITAQDSKGSAVVNYFTAQTNDNPAACNSFTRGPGDTSMLAQMCINWASGQWGHQSRKLKNRMFDHAFYVANTYHWVILDNISNCDGKMAAVSPDDVWKIYVR